MGNGEVGSGLARFISIVTKPAGYIYLKRVYSKRYWGVFGEKDSR
jgi:hypothetical protein